MTLALTIQRLFREYETALPGEIGLVVGQPLHVIWAALPGKESEATERARREKKDRGSLKPDEALIAIMKKRVNEEPLARAA